MDIEQKDIMQLIGDWGYTPQSILDEMNTLEDSWKNKGDRIGLVALEVMSSMCRYAQTNDLIESVTKKYKKHKGFSILNQDEAEGFIAEVLINKLIGDFNKISDGAYEMSLEKYCETVISSTYESVYDKDSLEDAILYVRQKVLNGLAPVFIKDMAAEAYNSGKTIHEMILKMSIVRYERQSGVFRDYTINRKAISKFDKTTRVLYGYYDRIMDIPNKIYPEFTTSKTILDAMYADTDIPSCFKCIKDGGLISLSKRLPHEIYEFSLSYMRILTLFYIGIALGLFTVDEFEEVMGDSFVLGDDILDENALDELERNRTN